MKCECGCDRFHAEQTIYLEVIVDEHGEFVKNTYGTMEESIFDGERPNGPYRCTNCGKSYESLDDDDDEELEG